MKHDLFHLRSSPRRILGLINRDRCDSYSEGKMSSGSLFYLESLVAAVIESARRRAGNGKVLPMDIVEAVKDVASGGEPALQGEGDKEDKTYGKPGL